MTQPSTTRTLGTVPLLLAVACASPMHGAATAVDTVRRPPEAAAATLPSLRGFWQTEGYGLELEFSETGALSLHQVTAISCLRSSQAEAVEIAPERATYRRARSDDAVSMALFPTASADRIRIHRTGTASDLTAVRLPGPIAACRRETPNTPLSNFDVFAATWAEHYPFFKEKQTDWRKLVATHRARVTETTSPVELFNVFEAMVAPLHDAHVALEAEAIQREFASADRDRQGALNPETEADAARQLVARYLGGRALTPFCERQLEFGILEGGIAYVRIRGFFGYHPDRSFASALSALESAMDTLFADTSTWRGLVIDIRINGGGYDPLGLAIASRLASAPYVAYAKQARIDPEDPNVWSKEQPSVVAPSSRPGWHGRVALLTGPNAVSAAETFTQALMGRTPKVARIGQNTQGVFSDVLVRKLPNGFQFGLPNERFVTNGTTYDGKGIPPDVRVPIFTKSDFEEKRDTALEAAMRLF